MFHSPYGLPVDDFDHLLVVSFKSEKTWSEGYKYSTESQVTFCTQVSDESTGAKKRMSAL